MRTSTLMPPLQSNSPNTRLQTSSLNLRLAEAALLRLTGHDQTCGIRRRRFQHLAGEKHDRGFENGEDEREERRGHHREFDRRGAVVLA